MHELVQETLPNWQSQHYQDVEVALYLLYSLAEAVPVCLLLYHIYTHTGLFCVNSYVSLYQGIHAQSFQAENNKPVPLTEMMKLVSSNILILSIWCYMASLIKYESNFALFNLQLMTSRVSCFQHPAVLQQFFEIVVRYDKFFAQEPSYIPDVLVCLTVSYIYIHSLSPTYVQCSCY